MRQRMKTVSFNSSISLLMGPSSSNTQKIPPKPGLPALLCCGEANDCYGNAIETGKRVVLTRDETFSLNHKCLNKHYYVLQLDGAKPEITEPDSPPVGGTSTENLMEHHLSFNAFSGKVAAGTIHFSGSIARQNVQILLDEGSSDTFIQS